MTKTTTGTTIDKTNTTVIDGTRASTTEQKQAVMERLLTLWTGDFSNLRLGQVIAGAMSGVTPGLFAIEDSQLVEVVESYVTTHKPVSETSTTAL